MRNYFAFITVLLAIWLAWIYPIVAVARGKSLLRTIPVSWGLSFGYYIFVCFVLPTIVTAIDPKFGSEDFKTWVPDGRGLWGIGLLGWLPPLITGGIGKLIRKVMLSFRPRTDGVTATEGELESTGR